MLTLLVAAAHLALPQSSLRGTVTSVETGQPLGFSIVTLQPTGTRQFTDASGVFIVEGLAAGAYILSVRQIAYTPIDTPIVMREGGETIVQVTLRRLAIELPPVTIAATRCVDPGPPAFSDTALFAVFDQLQENARRYALLAETYPFRYTLEVTDRYVYQSGDTGKPTTRRLRFSSRDDHPYEVGRVVEPAWGPWGSPFNTLVIHSADLQDLGNQRFIRHHCFRFAGMDAINGDSLLRIDFEPTVRLGAADIAGSAYLHPSTYELRYTATSLTRPELSKLTEVQSMTFWTRFHNIAPGVPLQDSLFVMTTYRYGPRAKLTTQRTRDVRFQRQPPPP